MKCIYFIHSTRKWSFLLGITAVLISCSDSKETSPIKTNSIKVEPFDIVTNKNPIEELNSLKIDLQEPQISIAKEVEPQIQLLEQQLSKYEQELKPLEENLNTTLQKLKNTNKNQSASKIQAEIQSLRIQLQQQIKNRQAILEADIGETQRAFKNSTAIRTLESQIKNLNRRISDHNVEIKVIDSQLLEIQKRKEQGGIKGLMYSMWDWKLTLSNRNKSSDLQTQKAQIIEQIKSLEMQKTQIQGEITAEERKITAGFNESRQAQVKAQSLFETQTQSLQTQIVELEKQITKKGPSIHDLSVKKMGLLKEIATINKAIKTLRIKLRVYKNVALETIRESISSKQKLKLKDVLEAFINQQAAIESIQSNLPIDETLLLRLSKLAKKSFTPNIEDFKISYEKNISQPIFFNASKNYLSDPLNTSRSNSLSSTFLHLNLALLAQIPNSKMVVIVEDGHILPGFIKKVKKQSHLFGIETTYIGSAIVDYGPIKKVKGQLRVFDSTQFLLIELLKFEIKNFNEIFKQLMLTTKKMGFETSSLYAFDENFDSQSFINKIKQTKTYYSSPLTFGTFPSADKDLVRTILQKK